MSKINTYIAVQAAQLQNPIAFSAVVTAQAVDVNAEIERIKVALSKEGTDATDHRLFLDEMSPVARASMYAILTALQTKITAA